MAPSGGLALFVWCIEGRFPWSIRNASQSCGLQGVVLEDAPVTLAEAKTQCEAAFLRLVGCKS